MQALDVIGTKSTYRPNSPPVCPQTKRFAEQTAEKDKKPAIVVYGLDSKDARKFFGGQDYPTDSFVEYYHHHRSHMERDRLPPIRELLHEVEKIDLHEPEVRSYVGGLVTSLARTAV